MILFHYNLSPYAEKIRVLMGYTNSTWQSVIVPPMPPRKGLDVLAGGYRRIPVAQQGADIFCDTRIITAELAEQVGNDDLSLQGCDTEVAKFAQRIEREKFMPSVRSVPPKAMLKQVLKNHNVITAFKLVRDRAKMGKAAAMRMPGASRSTSVLAEYLQELNQHLSQSFLFGDRPTIADFSAYHHVWFYHDLGGQALPDDTPALQAWFARMHAFGHGRREDKTMRYALDEARNSEPRAIADEWKSDKVGSEFTIAPDDYAHDSVTGVLAGESDSRYIVALATRKCGTVHVHFPKDGYAVS